MTPPAKAKLVLIEDDVADKTIPGYDTLGTPIHFENVAVNLECVEIFISYQKGGEQVNPIDLSEELEGARDIGEKNDADPEVDDNLAGDVEH